MTLMTHLPLRMKELRNNLKKILQFLKSSKKQYKLFKMDLIHNFNTLYNKKKVL